MISSSKRENSASSTSNDSNSNAVSNVRVGVRVRPLTASEISKGGKIVVNSKPWDQTVGIAKRMFTYDSVFDSKVSQEDLYQDISKPLLNSVLDGYNATVSQPNIHVQSNKYEFINYKITNHGINR